MTDTFDYELLEAALSDLDYVSEIAGASPDYHSLRRLSVQLRGLIIEGMLLQAWRNIKMPRKTPIIPAIRLPRENMNDSSTGFAGGGSYGGMRIVAHMRHDRALGPEEIARRASQGPPTKDYPLHEYKESASAVLFGKIVTRQQIVAYVAHKKGGAHLDRKRKKDEEAYVKLDAVAATYKIGGNLADLKSHDPVSYELLSIGQAICQSPDVVGMMAEIRQLLGKNDLIT